VDWQALRFAYAETPNFDPWRVAASARRCSPPIRPGTCDGAGEAQHILDENYTDIAAHMISDFASLSRRRYPCSPAGRYRDGLLKSIGPAMDIRRRPPLVISVTEEYDFCTT
jgi:hypothetical protein